MLLLIITFNLLLTINENKEVDSVGCQVILSLNLSTSRVSRGLQGIHDKRDDLAGFEEGKLMLEKSLDQVKGY